MAKHFVIEKVLSDVKEIVYQTGSVEPKIKIERFHNIYLIL